MCRDEFSGVRVNAFGIIFHFAVCYSQLRIYSWVHLNDCPFGMFGLTKRSFTCVFDFLTCFSITFYFFWCNVGNMGSSRTRNKGRKKSLFEVYMDKDDVSAGLKRGELIQVWKVGLCQNKYSCLQCHLPQSVCLCIYSLSKTF